MPDRIGTVPTFSILTNIGFLYIYCTIYVSGAFIYNSRNMLKETPNKINFIRGRLMDRAYSSNILCLSQYIGLKLDFSFIK